MHRATARRSAERYIITTIPGEYNGSPLWIVDAFSRAKARHISRKGVHTRAVSPHRSDLKVAAAPIRTQQTRTMHRYEEHFTRRRCITLAFAFDRRHVYANIQMHLDAWRARVSLPGFSPFSPSGKSTDSAAAVRTDTGVVRVLYGCQLFTWLLRSEWNNETDGHEH